MHSPLPTWAVPCPPAGRPWSSPGRISHLSLEELVPWDPGLSQPVLDEGGYGITDPSMLCARVDAGPAYPLHTLWPG